MEVTTSVEVRAPANEVFTYLSNVENNPEWQSGMVSAQWTSEGPMGVGSTYDQVATFLGRRIESTFVVEVFESGRMFRASSTGGSFPITFTRMVEPAEAGARVSAVITGEASGFFKVAEPLLRRMAQRSVDGDYRALADRFSAGNG